jgi:hypothetical protein
MGQFRNGWLLLTAGWASCLLITALDIYGLPASVKRAWEIVLGSGRRRKRPLPASDGIRNPSQRGPGHEHGASAG